jgi:hypothetical protein
MAAIDVVEGHFAGLYLWLLVNVSAAAAAGTARAVPYTSIILGTIQLEGTYYCPEEEQIILVEALQDMGTLGRARRLGERTTAQRRSWSSSSRPCRPW